MTPEKETWYRQTIDFLLKNPSAGYDPTAAKY